MAQAKNPGAIFHSSSFSHTLHLMCQEILSALTSKYIETLTYFFHIPCCRSWSKSCWSLIWSTAIASRPLSLLLPFSPSVYSAPKVILSDHVPALPKASQWLPTSLTGKNHPSQKMNNRVLKDPSLTSLPLPLWLQIILPCFLCFGYMDTLTISQTCRARPHLRAFFAVTASSAKILFTQMA